MKQLNYDVAVIGGGPAGLAAGLEAKRRGMNTIILERDSELGGILNQCIHSGFGLHYFKEELTGPEYAERFAKKVKESDADIYLNTMVIDIINDKQIVAVNREGLIKINAGSIVLAMGCRERTRGAIMVPGSRPAGIMTAGQAQRYLNIENLKPGNRAVILGSGDIGLITARRMKLEGIEVLGVYELMPYANGLSRNIKYCLEDFGIPLNLSTTVTKIKGNNRLEEIEVSRVDENLKVIPGTEKTIKCDTLILSIGLIPENELSLRAGVKLNPSTNGPFVDSNLQTNIPGIFACGNVLHVHDLVDNVTREGEIAGRTAAEFALNRRVEIDSIKIRTDENIRYTVPSFIKYHSSNNISINFRVKRPIENGRIIAVLGGSIIYQGRKTSFKPSKMENLKLNLEKINIITGELFLNIQEVR